MPNLKLDLINFVNTEKYFKEVELGRLAQDPNENYKTKIQEMSYILSEIALLNTKVGMIEQYFQEPTQQQQFAQQPQQVVHQGQTHGE